jgi:hypothetical protein
VPGYLPRVASVFVALALAGPALAADPPAETLPPPRPATPPEMAPGPALPPPVPPELMLFPRQNPYAVWQFYSPNYLGYWRPRVIATAQGGYYLYNGMPFPYTVYPGEYKPIVGNPATFGH